MNPPHFERILEWARDLKVLVVGDVLLDHNLVCRAERNVTTGAAFSDLAIVSQDQLAGGAGLTARAIKLFTDHVYLTGLVGCELRSPTAKCGDSDSTPDAAGQQIVNNLKKLDIRTDLLITNVAHETIEKRRIVRHEGDRLIPMLRLNRDMPSRIDDRDLARQLRETIHTAQEQVDDGQFDLIIAVDCQKGFFCDSVCYVMKELIEQQRRHSDAVFAICGTG